MTNRRLPRALQNLNEGSFAHCFRRLARTLPTAANGSLHVARTVFTEFVVCRSAEVQHRPSFVDTDRVQEIARMLMRQRLHLLPFGGSSPRQEAISRASRFGILLSNMGDEEHRQVINAVGIQHQGVTQKKEYVDENNSSEYVATM